MDTPTLSTALRFADYLLGGKLAEFISERRHQEKPASWQQISRDLRNATAGEVDVTDVTVTNWARTLGVADPPEQASA